MLKHVYKKSLGEKYYLKPEDVTLENSSDLFCALCGRSVKLFFDGQNWQFQHEPGDVTCPDELEEQNAASQPDGVDASLVVPRFPIRTDPVESSLGNLSQNRVSPSRTEENVLDILEALVPAMTPPQSPEDKQKLIGQKIDFDENELLEAGTQPIPMPDIELFSRSNQVQNDQTAPAEIENENALLADVASPSDAEAPKLENKAPLSETVDLNALEESDLTDIKAATAPSKSLIDVLRSTAVMPAEPAPVSTTEALDALTDEQIEAATKYLKEQRIENGVTQCQFQSNVYEAKTKDNARFQKIMIAIMIGLILVSAGIVFWLLRSDSEHTPALSDVPTDSLNAEKTLALDQTALPDDQPENQIDQPGNPQPNHGPEAAAESPDAPAEPLDAPAEPQAATEPLNDVDQTELLPGDLPLNEIPDDTPLSPNDDAASPLDAQPLNETQVAQIETEGSSDDNPAQTETPQNEQPLPEPPQPQAQDDAPKCAKVLETASSIRNRPEAKAKLLGTLSKNEKSVCFDEVKDNWLKFQYKGADAYICECATDYISPMPAKVKIASKQLGVRDVPDGKRIGSFSAGTQMQPIAQKGCWYEVKAKGKDYKNKTKVMHGYINRCYVNIVE